MTRTFRSAILAIAVAFVCPVFAGAAIVDDNAVFNLPVASAGPGGVPPLSTFSSTGPAGVSHSTSTWWYYRINGVDTQEFPLVNPVTNIQAGDLQKLEYQVGPLTLRLNIQVTGNGPGSASIVQTLAITNNTNARISVSAFNYLDPSLGGGPINSALLVDPNIIGVNATDWYAEFSGVGAAAFQAGPVNPSHLGLADASLTNFNSTILPIGPADIDLGYQWNINISKNFTASFTTTYSVISLRDPSDSLPEPATAAVLTPALALLGRRRRA